MSAPEWHGWKIEGTDIPTLHVGPHPRPGRKRPIMYLVIGAAVIPVATFHGEKAARETMRVIDALIGVVSKGGRL